jgi:putative endonuclease
LSRENRYYVYIMASRSLNLYTGVTNSVYQRALQHKSGQIDGFTKKYNINRLVYYEMFMHIGNAIAREKQVKAWTREKRLALIKSMNPTWQDLARDWGGKAELQIPRFARDDNFLDKSEFLGESLMVDRPSSLENKDAAVGDAEVSPLHNKSKTA